MLFVTRTGLLPARDWLIDQLEADQVGASVLAARGPGNQPLIVQEQASLPTMVLPWSMALVRRGRRDGPIGAVAGPGT